MRRVGFAASGCDASGALTVDERDLPIDGALLTQALLLEQVRRDDASRPIAVERGARRQPSGPGWRFCALLGEDVGRTFLTPR